MEEIPSSAPEGPPVTPRPAATVILLRRGGRHTDRGLEVLMLQRGKDARFMPGVWVFAGGVVDDADREGSAPDGEDADDWAHRVCAARELDEEGGVEIGAEAMLPWSRWITPTQVPARFDTRFYIALSPAHANPEPDGVEMDQARWIGPGEALEAGAAGEFELSFPTIRHLEELRDFDTADEVLAAAESREVPAILPRVVGTEDGGFDVLLPGEPGYDD